MRPFARSLCALATLLGVSTSLGQEQVRFTGQTSADEQLIHDAFQDIARYIRESLSCPSIEQVVAEVLPEGAVKHDPTQAEGTSAATYEQWTVSYCGRSRPFLVVFWAAKDGGTMYRIQLRPG